MRKMLRRKRGRLAAWRRRPATPARTRSQESPSGSGSGCAFDRWCKVGKGVGPSWPLPACQGKPPHSTPSGVSSKSCRGTLVLSNTLNSKIALLKKHGPAGLPWSAHLFSSSSTAFACRRACTCMASQREQGSPSSSVWRCSLYRAQSEHRQREPSFSLCSEEASSTYNYSIITCINTFPISPLDNEDTGVADLSASILWKLEALGAVILVLPAVREPGTEIKTLMMTMLMTILFANSAEQEHNLFVACTPHTERPLEFASSHCHWSSSSSSLQYHYQWSSEPARFCLAYAAALLAAVDLWLVSAHPSSPHILGHLRWKCHQRYFSGRSRLHLWGKKCNRCPVIGPRL